ncbi:hypothetical protein Tco_1092285 [Tanacetum coccineum]|uniref:Uncharacterized protein n=1 Tax=Tanacetum coccineum TaxID=301880 RepID=A0ABQ5I9F0_9ASTR
MSARIAKAAALSPSSFRKRYRSSYETPSPSSTLTLPVRKRYRGASELVEDIEDESLDSDAEREGSEDEGHGLEDEGPGLEEVEEAAASREGSMPSTFKIGQISRSVSEQQRVEETLSPRIPVHTTWIDPEDISPSSPIVPSPLASPATTPAATISVDKDQFLEGFDRDFGELYTRLREDSDEIFSQRYRLKSLEQEQERAIVTFEALWRLMLALEAWAGHHELQEIRGHIATLEQERNRREQ